MRTSAGSGALVLLGLAAAPALFDASDCEDNPLKEIQGCTIGGLDATPLIGWMWVLGPIFLPALLLAGAGLAIVGAIAAVAWLREQR